MEFLWNEEAWWHLFLPPKECANPLGVGSVGTQAFPWGKMPEYFWRDESALLTASQSYRLKLC